MMLKNKKILLGITGGIAIYKVLDLITLLKEEGASLKIILTHSAKKFITPLTFKSIIGSNNTVFSDDEFFTSSMLHIELAKWADILVIVPASANTIAKMANGFADNLLLTTYLAYKGKVAVLPAMNPTMWEQAALTNNLNILKQQQIKVWGPIEGKVSCGDFGFGKMLAPKDIEENIISELFPKALLGKKVVITAGPTIEELDEVRFFSNHSSGMMGYSLAQIASFLGAEVTLISGPSNLKPPSCNKVITVKSAKEMEVATKIAAKDVDFLIMAAAVADFTPITKFSGKLTKAEALKELQFTLNNDILQTLTASLNPKPFYIGFALENENLLNKAKAKLIKKGVDIIVANKIGQNTGFKSDTNEVYLVTKENDVKRIPLMPKAKLAVAIWAELLEIYLKKFINLK